MRSACKQVGIDPARVCEWCDASDEVAQHYARAKEESADKLAEEIVEIADEAAGEVDAAAVQAARLRVDARKWVASKLKPKRYGDAQKIEHSGTVDIGFADALKAARARVIDDQL